MKNKKLYLPATEEIEEEIQRVRRKQSYRRVLKSTLAGMITFAAVLILISTLLLPVYRVHGDGMSPTLANGQLVVGLRNAKPQAGDVIAFYYNNKILIKRVIAVGGDEVDLDGHGTVTVNGQEQQEAFYIKKAYGDCNIELPYTVPESKFFVMGDNRTTSVDSRHTEVGCISEEQIIGEVILRIWPVETIAVLN